MARRQTPLCILHIGKTGGSFLRSVLRHNKPRWTAPLELLGHPATLASSARRFGPDRRLGFLIRDPLARFSSAFYSRQRQGRPTYDSPWSAEEAAAFLWFETANDLAEALGSENPRDLSAARFAMRAIEHLGRDYRYHFGTVAELEAEAPRIAFCCDIADLDANMGVAMAALGLVDFELPKAPRHHRAPQPAPALSGRAKEALQVYWAEEFALYEAARKLSARWISK